MPVLLECIEPFSAEDRRDAAAPNTFPSRVMYETSTKASESSAAWSFGWSPACTDSASHMLQHPVGYSDIFNIAILRPVADFFGLLRHQNSAVVCDCACSLLAYESSCVRE